MVHSSSALSMKCWASNGLAGVGQAIRGSPCGAAMSYLAYVGRPKVADDGGVE
jgi:hypothetical protein